jgi:hypothetical protein
MYSRSYASKFSDLPCLPHSYLTVVSYLNKLQFFLYLKVRCLNMLIVVFPYVYYTLARHVVFKHLYRSRAKVGDIV